MSSQPILLFGGSFDPIHLGHTEVAADAAAQLHAERVIFIPAKQSPLKSNGPSAGDQDRMTMIQYAIENNPAFEVSDYELNRPAPSYSLHTVRHFRQKYGPKRSLHWLIGADAVTDLMHWYGVLELMDLCYISTMVRAGCAKPDFSVFTDQMGEQRVAQLDRHVLPTPLVSVSSTEVRHRLATHESVETLLAPKVYAYIENKGLYGDLNGTGAE